jgi:hypothetical protein
MAKPERDIEKDYPLPDFIDCCPACRCPSNRASCSKFRSPVPSFETLALLAPQDEVFQ